MYFGGEKAGVCSTQFPRIPQLFRYDTEEKPCSPEGRNSQQSDRGIWKGWRYMTRLYFSLSSLCGIQGGCGLPDRLSFLTPLLDCKSQPCGSWLKFKYAFHAWTENEPAGRSSFWQERLNFRCAWTGGYSKGFLPTVTSWLEILTVILKAPIRNRLNAYTLSPGGL